MKLLFQLLVMIIVLPATYYFVLWVPLSLIPPPALGMMSRSIIALLSAAAIGWYTWNRLRRTPDSLVSCAMTGALVLGAIGFCGGFFGPMIFVPEANQGPMLGIFITGPLGFAAGAVGGFIYWLVQRNKVSQGAGTP